MLISTEEVYGVASYTTQEYLEGQWPVTGKCIGTEYRLNALEV